METTTTTTRIVINYESVNEYYQAELWTVEDVQKAVQKGYITEMQAREILGE